MGDCPWRLLFAELDCEFQLKVDEVVAILRGPLVEAGIVLDGLIVTLVDTHEHGESGVLDELVDTNDLTSTDRASFSALVVFARTSVGKRRRLFARAPSAALVAMRVVDTRAGVAALVVPGADAPPPPEGRPHRWPTRLRRDLAVGDQPGALLHAEERDRERWVEAASRILVEDAYPLAHIATGAGNQGTLLRRAFGGRRGRTIRLRVRVWRKVRSWLAASGRPRFLVGVEGARDLIDYLEELAVGRCARSVPRAVSMALQFFEACGAVRVDDRISSHPLVVNAIKDMERELALGSTRAKRRAPHYHGSVVAALERAVLDHALQPYKRVFCWWKLVRLWASLRFDDILHVRPQDVAFTDVGLSLTSHSTKATGAGKKVELVQGYVSVAAFIEVEGWLKVGYELLVHLAGHVPRDYLLPLPTPDFGGMRNGPALYHDALNMTRTMLGELCRPVGAGVAREVLLDPAAATFWSEHGDRAQLASWAACCGVSRVAIDALGRWRAGSSDDYIRTARVLVLDTQALVGRTLREKQAVVDLYGEELLLDDLGRH